MSKLCCRTYSNMFSMPFVAKQYQPLDPITEQGLTAKPNSDRLHCFDKMQDMKFVEEQPADSTLNLVFRMCPLHQLKPVKG